MQQEVQNYYRIDQTEQDDLPSRVLESVKNYLFPHKNIASEVFYPLKRRIVTVYVLPEKIHILLFQSSQQLVWFRTILYLYHLFTAQTNDIAQ